MEETQSFRLSGITEIKKVPVHNVDGENVVYWESIEQVYPGVQSIKNGDSEVPSGIKHSPDIVLDVVLSSSTELSNVDSQLQPPSTALIGLQAERLGDPSIKGNLVEDLRVVQADTDSFRTAHSDTPPSGKATAALFLQIVKARVQESKIEKKFLSYLPPELQEKVSRSPNVYEAYAQAVRDGQFKISFAELSQELKELRATMTKDNEELKAAMTKDKEELRAAMTKDNEKLVWLNKQLLDGQELMKQQLLDEQKKIEQLQIQALDQMVALHTRIQAVFTQTYELHEYPIPRLFVVLIQEPKRWDPSNLLSNKFRFYFLCECGEHTKSVDSKSHIHFAKHAGYEIARPNEFFELYGSHILTVLKMLKNGISVAGIVVPTISHLVPADLATAGSKYLKALKDGVDLINPLIDCMDKNSKNEGKSIDGFSEQMENKEALEGADLRKLDTFLKVKDEARTLGNLYRTVTHEGHVKWVCIDHYRENYQEYTAKEFQSMLNSVGGTFNRNIGRVEVKLRSKVLAEKFYFALARARSVYDLDIVFDWAYSTSDLEALEVALKATRVSILRLDIQYFKPRLTTKLFLMSNLSIHYEVFFRLQRLPNMRIVHIVLPKEFLMHPSFQIKPPSDLCRLSFEFSKGYILAKDHGAFFEALGANSTLTTLDLKNNFIGDEGAQALSEALRTNSTLTSLNMKGSSIGDNGAQALSEVLKKNSTLTTLVLGYNSIGEKGGHALSEALKINSTLTTLDLSACMIGREGSQALSEALRNNSTLTTLDLSACLIRREGVQALSEALKNNSTLTTLDLSGNQSGDGGAQALSEALRTNSTLTILDLNGNSIGDKGAQIMSEALRINSTLTTLGLHCNSIGDKGAQALSETLQINSTLTTLALRYNSIGDNGAQALSEALKINSSLTTLVLGYNSIGEKGGQALSEALKINSTLTTLDLSDCLIRREGAQALSEALKNNSTLTTLDLSGNQSGDGGAQALSEALRTNSTLTTLDLNGNSIGDKGAQILSEALRINSTLTTLDLYCNSIGDKGAWALSETLQINSTLTTLALGHNSIGEKGAQALSKALKINSTLTTLVFCYNSIGEKGVQALSEALKINLTLTSLSLSFSPIEEKGIRALSEAVKINSTLTTLILHGSSVGVKIARAMSEGAKTNLNVIYSPEI